MRLTFVAFVALLPPGASAQTTFNNKPALQTAADLWCSDEPAALAFLLQTRKDDDVRRPTIADKITSLMALVQGSLCCALTPLLLLSVAVGGGLPSPSPRKSLAPPPSSVLTAAGVFLALLMPGAAAVDADLRSSPSDAPVVAGSVATIAVAAGVVAVIFAVGVRIGRSSANEQRMIQSPPCSPPEPGGGERSTMAASDTVQLPPSRVVSVPPASAPPGSDSLPRTRRPVSPSKLAAFETLGEGAARFPRLSSASNMTASDALGGVGEQEASEKHRALTRLQRAVRHVIQDWLAPCSPITFRTSNPKRPYPLPIFADHGFIRFPARSEARFIHLADSREPYKSDESYCKSVLDLMEKHWMMEPASVLISISGGAQDFKLQPRLLKAFRHGLAKVAQVNAWVFTGGGDSGVTALVGDALSDAQSSAKMVGICTWASVMGKDRLEGCYGDTRDMVHEAPNNRNAANLEPYHTCLSPFPPDALPPHGAARGVWFGV